MAVELGNPGDPFRLVREGIRLQIGVGAARSGRYQHQLTALVDTGAPLTYYIDVSLAVQLELRSVGDVDGEGLSVETRSVKGIERYPAFLAGVFVGPLGLTVPVARLIAFNIKAIDNEIDLIIGRGFLQNYKMIYAGPSGSVTLATHRPKLHARAAQ